MSTTTSTVVATELQSSLQHGRETYSTFTPRLPAFGFETQPESVGGSLSEEMTNAWEASHATLPNAIQNSDTRMAQWNPDLIVQYEETGETSNPPEIPINQGTRSGSESLLLQQTNDDPLNPSLNSVLTEDTAGPPSVPTEGGSSNGDGRTTDADEDDTFRASGQNQAADPSGTETGSMKRDETKVTPPPFSALQMNGRSRMKKRDRYEREASILFRNRSSSGRPGTADMSKIPLASRRLETANTSISSLIWQMSTSVDETIHLGSIVTALSREDKRLSRKLQRCLEAVKKNCYGKYVLPDGLTKTDETEIDSHLSRIESGCSVQALLKERQDVDQSNGGKLERLEAQLHIAESMVAMNPEAWATIKINKARFSHTPLIHCGQSSNMLSLAFRASRETSGSIWYVGLITPSGTFPSGKDRSKIKHRPGATLDETCKSLIRAMQEGDRDRIEATKKETIKLIDEDADRKTFSIPAVMMMNEVGTLPTDTKYDSTIYDAVHRALTAGEPRVFKEVLADDFKKAFEDDRAHRKVNPSTEGRSNIQDVLGSIFTDKKPQLVSGLASIFTSVTQQLSKDAFDTERYTQVRDRFEQLIGDAELPDGVRGMNIQGAAAGQVVDSYLVARTALGEDAHEWARALTIFDN